MVLHLKANANTPGNSLQLSTIGSGYTQASITRPRKLLSGPLKLGVHFFEERLLLVKNLLFIFIVFRKVHQKKLVTSTIVLRWQKDLKS